MPTGHSDNSWSGRATPPRTSLAVLAAADAQHPRGLRVRDCPREPRGAARRGGSGGQMASCPALAEGDRGGSPPITAKCVLLLLVGKLCSEAGRCIIGHVCRRSLGRRDHSTYCTAAASLLLALAPIRGPQPSGIWRRRCHQDVSRQVMTESQRTRVLELNMEGWKYSSRVSGNDGRIAEEPT